MKPFLKGAVWICFALFLNACAKEDSLQSAENTDIASANLSTQGITSLPWKSDLDWEVTERESLKIYQTSISLDDASNIDLVRVFMDNSAGSEAVSLPIEITQNGQKEYWYYQQSGNELLLLVDVYGNNSPQLLNDANFKIIAMNADAVTDYSAKGIEREAIMNLSLNNIK